MPLVQYFVGVGGVLLCLMLALNVYLPKAPPREQRDIDKSTIRITARPSADFVIDRFPPVRSDGAIDPSDAVRKALAMMPADEGQKQSAGTARADSPQPAPRRKRIAQRSQVRIAGNDGSPAAASQPPQGWGNNGWSNGSWSNNNWSHSWPNNSQGNWSNNNWNNSWSRGWASNQWSR